MFLTVLDLILILALFIFIAFGFTLGLIEAIGAIIGVFAGAFVANLFFVDFANFLTPIFLGNKIAAEIVSFALIFFIVNRLVGLIFHVVGKVFNLIAIIPFVKTFNRLLGAIFGLIEGILVLGLMIIFIFSLNVSLWVNNIIDASVVANWLTTAAGFLIPLIPEVINQAKQVI
ncbi:MAG: CvpA family protein [Candidatus Buchananbacteria bacterium]